MKIFHAIEQAQDALAGAALALGNFDGVHLGHLALFEAARRLGRPAALTFHPHPGKVLQPDLAPKLITTLHRKLELLSAAGLEATLVLPFTKEFARTSAEQFEAELFDQLRAAHAIVGGDFTYGVRRSGNVDTLRGAAAKRGAGVQLVAPVTVEGVLASSTRIREYILEGRVGAARRLLGRYFDVDGTVVPGQGRGRGLGFPTANVDTQNELRPAAGVFAARARLLDKGGAEEPGPWRSAAANIGIKPTFGGGEVTLEIHLLDFSGDLYGRSLRVQFLERLRDERRFASVDELSGQIQRDIEAAREVCARADE